MEERKKQQTQKLLSKNSKSKESSLDLNKEGKSKVFKNIGFDMYGNLTTRTAAYMNFEHPNDLLIQDFGEEYEEEYLEEGDNEVRAFLRGIKKRYSCNTKAVKKRIFKKPNHNFKSHVESIGSKANIGAGADSN